AKIAAIEGLNRFNGASHSSTSQSDEKTAPTLQNPESLLQISLQTGVKGPADEIGQFEPTSSKYLN
ncbi:MAG TPA: hypothetical protein VMB26_09960, partial [Candidatus Binataceae bacterium]|nr:hypothetical protein [Candidatus Binataceae bacterium]